MIQRQVSSFLVLFDQIIVEEFDLHCFWYIPIVWFSWSVSDLLSCLAKRNPSVYLFPLHRLHNVFVTSKQKMSVLFCCNLKLNAKKKTVFEKNAEENSKEHHSRGNFLLLKNVFGHLPFLIWYNVYSSVNLTIICLFVVCGQSVSIKDQNIPAFDKAASVFMTVVGDIRVRRLIKI